MSKIKKIATFVNKRHEEYQKIFFVLGELRWAHRKNDAIKNFIDRLYLIFSQYRNVPRQLSIPLTPKDISVPLYPIILFELGYKIIEPSDERLLTFERISN